MCIDMKGHLSRLCVHIHLHTGLKNILIWNVFIITEVLQNLPAFLYLSGVWILFSVGAVFNQAFCGMPHDLKSLFLPLILFQL